MHDALDVRQIFDSQKHAVVARDRTDDFFYVHFVDKRAGRSRRARQSFHHDKVARFVDAHHRFAEQIEHFGVGVAVPALRLGIFVGLFRRHNLYEAKLLYIPRNRGLRNLEAFFYEGVRQVGLSFYVGFVYDFQQLKLS